MMQKVKELNKYTQLHQKQGPVNQYQKPKGATVSPAVALQRKMKLMVSQQARTALSSFVLCLV